VQLDRGALYPETGVASSTPSTKSRLKDHISLNPHKKGKKICTVVKKAQVSLCGPTFAHANQLLSCKFEDKKKGAGGTQICSLPGSNESPLDEPGFLFNRSFFRYIFIFKICGIKLREEIEVGLK
jgi:hypothetical protein